MYGVQYDHTWTLDDRGVALAKLFRYLSAKVSATGSLRSMVTLSSSLSAELVCLRTDTRGYNKIRGQPQCRVLRQVCR